MWNADEIPIYEKVKRFVERDESAPELNERIHCRMGLVEGHAIRHGAGAVDNKGNPRNWKPGAPYKITYGLTIGSPMWEENVTACNCRKLTGSSGETTSPINPSCRRVRWARFIIYFASLGVAPLDFRFDDGFLRNSRWRRFVIVSVLSDIFAIEYFVIQYFLVEYLITQYFVMGYLMTQCNSLFRYLTI